MSGYGSPNQVVMANAYRNITTNTTTNVKVGAGVLHAVIVGTPAATGTITIYDNTAASGTIIATITMVAGQAYYLPFNTFFTTGLTVVTAVAAGNITIAFT